MEDSEVRINLKDEKILEYVISRCVEEANSRQLAREERAHRRFVITSSILGVALLSGAITLTKYFVSDSVRLAFEAEKSSIEDRARAISAELDSTSQKIQDQIALQSLRDAIRELEQSIGFSNDDKKRIMSLLENIKKSKNTQNSPQLPVLLESLLESFTSADLQEEVSKIDTLFEEQLLSNTTSSFRLCNHYGQNVVGSVSLAEAVVDIERMKLYCGKVGVNGFPELKLLYDLLYEFKAANLTPTKSTDKLVAGVEYLKKADREAFVDLLARYSDASTWTVEPTQEARIIQQVALELLAAYPDIAPHITSQGNGTR
ncbi:hypothetical protein [Enterovibrio calviensis]|uniref:hypothetical protein n=1 Tax=Enterovibrio calviensis TaxID=91359 RepID=UPI00047F2268|nr:hypothetical protein [Enterovibrio calviensis]